MQLILLNVCQSLHRWSPDGQERSLRRWLSGLSRNTLLKFLCHQKLKPRGHGGSDFLLAQTELPERIDTADRKRQDYERENFRCATQLVQCGFRPSSWHAFPATAVILRANNEQFDAVSKVLVGLDQGPVTPGAWSDQLRSHKVSAATDQRRMDLLKKSPDDNARPSGSQNGQFLTVIREAIDEAFTQWPREQLAGIEELTGRLQKLSQSVREREARRDEIVNQRLVEQVTTASRSNRETRTTGPAWPGTVLPQPAAQPFELKSGAASSGAPSNAVNLRASPVTTVDSTPSAADSLGQRLQQHSSTARRQPDESTRGQRRDPSIGNEIDYIQAMVRLAADDARVQMPFISRRRERPHRSLKRLRKG
jgi:hypothetical protein